MSLTLDDVRRVAALARFTLSPEEEQRYLGQLSAILEAVAELEALDTSGVVPTSHATLGEVLMREDLAQLSTVSTKVLQAAPARVGTHFSVPKILD